MQKSSNKLLPGCLLIPLLVVCLVASCNKAEERYIFLWDQTYGVGSAMDVSGSADSGIVASGHVDGTPYLLKLSKLKTVEFEYSSTLSGRFTSHWFDTTCYIAAGSSNGSLLLTKIDSSGAPVWDTTLTAGFDIDFASLHLKADNSFLAIGSASADTGRSGVTGLFFVEFDIHGDIITTREMVETTSIYAEGAALDGEGNIYLSMTRRYGDLKTTSGVAKYNADGHKLWERFLYNNPSYGAAGKDMIYNDGVLYMAGRTETLREEVIVNNSFIVALSPYDGSDIWKRYCEKSNTGVAMVSHPTGSIMMLNLNCFVVTLTDIVEGADLGKIRMFDACDSYNNMEKGADISLYDNDKLLIGGSRGGNFFVALKSTDVVDEF